ncbi:DNA topology modulation protein FlaR [Roseibium sp.]|uniref:DNA topology modulation protein FlaR n=1 Tax=Roseibium sp. TaxID=1936156 RepID=UPI003B510A29
MKRVMIVGGPGSGKSTLARRLGERTGLPVFHMDKIHWCAGWVERARDEKDRMTHEVHIQDRWIFEGGHSSTYPERVARADTFVWLDVPVGLRIFRVLKRSVVNYGTTRPDLADGCPERLDFQTIEFLRFIWRTRHSARAKLLAVYQEPPRHLDVFRLTTKLEFDAFLRTCAERGDQDLHGTSTV